MTDLSLMNPGTSIQFDARAVADMQLQGEREHQEEENENRQEIMQLLNDASFEDLLDDDDILGASIHDSAYTATNTSTFKSQPHPMAPVPYTHSVPQSDTQLDASIFDGNIGGNGQPAVFMPQSDERFPGDDMTLQQQTDPWAANSANLSLSDYTITPQDTPFTGTNPVNHWVPNPQDQWINPTVQSDDLNIYHDDQNFDAQMSQNQNFNQMDNQNMIYAQTNNPSITQQFHDQFLQGTTDSFGEMNGIPMSSNLASNAITEQQIIQQSEDSYAQLQIRKNSTENIYQHTQLQIHKSSSENIYDAQLQIHKSLENIYQDFILFIIILLNIY